MIKIHPLIPPLLILRLGAKNLSPPKSLNALMDNISSDDINCETI